MSGKRVLKVISNLVTTVLFIVLLLTLFLVVSTKASGGEPNFFGYQLKTVLSGSMEPTIQTGSIIPIKEVDDPTSFQTGDVITYQTEEDILVTHRITEVNEGGNQYITKGDANDAADMEPVNAMNIVGAYTGISIPYIGYVMDFANSSEGAALLLVIPGVFLIIYAGVTIWRAFRQLDQAKKEVNPNTE
ncbi:signal peptidase I [Virgibacillus sp. NKC19-3]|uniref:signal peptidase I SipW n=1 Tax=Virgibacillus saliphilus TaxID=2831674 RepID=UPI001C9A625E|nr:signal peptidase I [Virgibacillus sp. NKC19-3]MBY7142658.1 signal peptidase I [Virgibacillus sp. NKC19-3]